MSLIPEFKVEYLKRIEVPYGEPIRQVFTIEFEKPLIGDRNEITISFKDPITREWKEFKKSISKGTKIVKNITFEFKNIPKDWICRDISILANISIASWSGKLFEGVLTAKRFHIHVKPPTPIPTPVKPKVLNVQISTDKTKVNVGEDVKLKTIITLDKPCTKSITYNIQIKIFKNGKLIRTIPEKIIFTSGEFRKVYTKTLKFEREGTYEIKVIVNSVESNIVKVEVVKLVKPPVPTPKPHIGKSEIVKSLTVLSILALPYIFKD